MRRSTQTQVLKHLRRPTYHRLQTARETRGEIGRWAPSTPGPTPRLRTTPPSSGVPEFSNTPRSGPRIPQPAGSAREGPGGSLPERDRPGARWGLRFPVMPQLMCDFMGALNTPLNAQGDLQGREERGPLSPAQAGTLCPLSLVPPYPDRSRGSCDPMSSHWETVGPKAGTEREPQGTLSGPAPNRFRKTDGNFFHPTPKSVSWASPRRDI